tara:strand:+ start:2313 stop:2549 length:237 start_codon:yes stop_codon:yes gene_type:complete
LKRCQYLEKKKTDAKNNVQYTNKDIEEKLKEKFGQSFTGTTCSKLVNIITRHYNLNLFLDPQRLIWKGSRVLKRKNIQ